MDHGAAIRARSRSSAMPESDERSLSKSHQSPLACRGQKQTVVRSPSFNAVGRRLLQRFGILL
jgi:hypothetical protein